MTKEIKKTSKWSNTAVIDWKVQNNKDADSPQMSKHVEHNSYQNPSIASCKLDKLFLKYMGKGKRTKITNMNKMQGIFSYNFKTTYTVIKTEQCWQGANACTNGME